MPILLLLAGLAGAADTSAYPMRAPVDLPATGVVRIHVPLALRTPEDPKDASDLLLVDGNGKVVPVARIATSTSPTDVHQGPTFAVTPTAQPDTWVLQVRERPIDEVTVLLAGDAAVATATVEAFRAGQWEAASDPALVWVSGSESETEVPLSGPALGTLRLHLAWHGPHLPEPPTVGARTHPGPHVPYDHVTAKVHDWLVQEDGNARYDVYLPQAWPAAWLEVHPSEPLFNRQAGVASLTEGAPSSTLEYDPTPYQMTTIERLHLGGTDIERTRVDVPEPPSDRLAVLVQTQGAPPLHIPDVEVFVPGVQLLAEEAGPGPHVLYGGAPPSTSPPSDLAAARTELARLAPTVIEPGTPEPNPAFVPPEVKAHLTGPSVPLDLASFRWVHQVTGPTGLVRIPVPPEALAKGRSDLGDLRLVDEKGRQIPYVLRRRPGQEDHGKLQFTRTERGSKSILNAKLPVKGVPISVVRLVTSAPVFRRQVAVARTRGAHLQILRAYEWVGDQRPGQLDLEVGAVVGDSLVITIDNGSNPPLPIDEVDASWPGWDLWAGLPAGGARLVYGNPSATAPSYDLALLRDQIGRRVAAVAKVGPAKPLARPPLAWSDRLLLLVGIAFLGLGLVVLTVRLLRAVPEPPEEKGEPPAAEPEAS